ncbi:MAG: hypothetical protein OHK0015_16390 [Chloroflexi bacterium OHK40]
MSNLLFQQAKVTCPIPISHPFEVATDVLRHLLLDHHPQAPRCAEPVLPPPANAILVPVQSTPPEPAGTEMIVLLDETGHYQYTNAALATTLRLNNASLIGSRPASQIHPDDLPEVRTSWAATCAGKRQPFKCRLRDGEGAWRRIEGSFEWVGSPTARMLLVVAREATDREARETAMLHAQRAMLVGLVASSFVHDMNNLLAVIQGSTALALEDLPADHPARDNLLPVQQASAMVGALNRRLLAFLRCQQEEARELNLAEFLAEHRPLFEPIAGRRARLSIQTVPDLWPVRVEPTQIGQLLANLLINAREAMPDGGNMTLRAQNVTIMPPRRAEAGAYVCLSLTDDGTGIDPAVQARIFEPFFTTRTDGKHTGLGLTICRWIVEQHGGWIELESTLGHGSTFRCYLPRHTL